MEGPSTITIMNCTSRWTSGCLSLSLYLSLSLSLSLSKHLDVVFIMVIVLFFPSKKRPSSAEMDI